MTTSYVKIITGKCDHDIVDPPITFNYECDHFQKHAFLCISEGENLLVTAHTGSGKTTIAEYAVANTIRNGKNVVYTSPIKSLSNEKYNDFGKKFHNNPTVNLGILTGDNKINPDGNCLIMTAEILRNALYKLKSPSKVENEKYENIDNNFIQNIGCVIMDEVHFINDLDRGKVWEETLILLDKNVQLILLSATISQPEKFAEWIGNIKTKTINLISTTHRAVPLRHYIYTGEKMHLIFDQNCNFKGENFMIANKEYDEIQKLREKQHKNLTNLSLIQNMVNFLHKNDMLQAIFFSFSKKNCELYAQKITENLVDHNEIAEINIIFNKYMHKYEHQYAKLEQYQIVKKLLLNGVAYHHSGLLPILKEIIEIIFHKGLIKVLFATETFAVGVNMPTRTVIFTELEKHTNTGKRDINTAEYKQMSGRAGRRGLDTSGNVIILPIYNFPELGIFRNMLQGSVPCVESKFKIDYQFLLKTMQSEVTDVWKFINDSLYFVEHNKIINSNKIELTQIESELCNDSLNKKFSELNKQTMDKIKEYHNLKTATPMVIPGVKMVMSKSQSKKLTTLTREFSIEPLAELYRQYCHMLDLENKKNIILENLLNSQTFIDNTLLAIKNLLAEHNFIDDSILKKGVIAAQINECNSLLLTEMIISGFFDDLTAPEIVGLLALFIDEGEDISFENIGGTPKLKHYISDLTVIINEYIQSEYKCGIEGNEDFWLIKFGFVDIAYKWAIGEDIQTDGLYVGNFIRSMIKINNIAKDLKYLFEIAGNISVIPVLEQIEPLIMRDYVTVNSLYLLS